MTDTTGILLELAFGSSQCKQCTDNDESYHQSTGGNDYYHESAGTGRHIQSLS